MSDGCRSTTTSGSSGDDNKALLNGHHKHHLVGHHNSQLDNQKTHLGDTSQEYEVRRGESRWGTSAGINQTSIL